MHDRRLVRESPIAVAPLRAGFRLATHVLGHSRVVCDARVVEILDWHDRPRRADEVAAHFGESEKAVAFVLGHLVQAQLLVPEGFDSGRRIRGAFASRRADLPRVAPTIALPGGGIDRWEAPDETMTELERAALALAPRSRLSLSPHVVSLGVGAGERLALHPLRERVHLRAPLWRLAAAFGAPTTIAAVARRLGLRSMDEVVTACRFLVLRGLLWPSRAVERRAFGALADRLHVRAGGPSARQWSEPHHQWTDVAVPHDWSDVARMTAFGRVAVVGQCQLNFVGAALQRLARRHHVHLELAGEPVPSPALARTSWAAVFLSLADCAVELHDAVARGDGEEAWAQIPRVLAEADALVAEVRRHTPAPLAVISVGPPSLAPFPESAAAHHLHVRIYAELNERLAEALAGSDAVLIDESRFTAGRGERVVLDDEYTGSAHHCAYNPRFWIELTQWTGADAERRTFPAGDPQAGAADGIAAGLFDFLRRRHEPVPVRVAILGPDGLLWPGAIGARAAAHDSLQRSLGRPDYQFYCGVNEALLRVRARGVKLVCLSPLPEEVLRAKWDVPGSSTAFVGPEHLERIVGSRAELRLLLAQLGVREEECLWLGLGRGSAPAGGRVFRGDRWAIKRYLLTAPELTPARPVAALRDRVDPGPPVADDAGATPRLPAAAIPATVDAAIARHLRLGAATRTLPDDLRMLGLDSLTALELVHEIEAKIGAPFADRDLTVATIYRRSTLLDAALRARPGTTHAGSRPRGGGERADPLATCGSITDLIAHHAGAARHPWQLKMVRSTRPNDYEYAGWSTLLERARGYADLFSRLGGRPGDVVTLMLPQGIALVSAFLGAILHDFVPSIVAAPSEKLAASAFAAWFGEVAVRSTTRLVLCSPEHEPLVRACVAASRAPEIAVSSLVPAPLARSARPAGRSPGRPLLLQHSSGTTGLKKGVRLDEGAVLAQVRHLAAALRCDSRDVVVSWAPLYHDMGLVACLLLPLLADLPLVMMSPFDWLRAPELILREVSRERGTLSWMPNFAFLYSAQRIPEESLRGLDLSSWRAIVNCSEPVTAGAADAFARRFASVGLRRSALSASFAMAETTFAVTQVPPGRGLVHTAVEAERWRRDGIARPADPSAVATVVLSGSGEVIGGTAVEIVDARGRVLGEGEAGEIRVRADSLMQGYFGDPGATAGALRDGWYSTGDVGVLLGRELYVTGRKKDLVIVAGQNVYPHDVEESLGALPGIKPGRVVALGVADESRGTERLVVLAETLGELDPEQREELRERVRAHVSSVFGVPAHDVRLFGEPKLVKSTSGKLSRARNRDLYLEHVAREAGAAEAHIAS